MLAVVLCVERAGAFSNVTVAKLAVTDDGRRLGHAVRVLRCSEAALDSFSIGDVIEASTDVIQFGKTSVQVLEHAEVTGKVKMFVPEP